MQKTAIFQCYQTYQHEYNNEIAGKENIDPGHKSTEEVKQAPGVLQFCCNMIGSEDACIEYLRCKRLLAKSMSCWD